MCDSTAALCPSIADQRNSPGCRDQRRPGGNRSDGSIAWQSRSSLSGRRFEHRDDSEIIRYRPATRKPSQGLPYTRVKVEQTDTCSSIFPCSICTSPGAELLDGLCPCYAYDLTAHSRSGRTGTANALPASRRRPLRRHCGKPAEGDSRHLSGSATKMASAFIAQRPTIEKLVDRSHCRGEARGRTSRRSRGAFR
ncbi:hypothetical protein J2802_001490 [Paraburkholderia caribensis]|nr:hypothetical protein [Paraburkholderia caribensis]